MKVKFFNRDLWKNYLSILKTIGHANLNETYRHTMDN
jgi:hypothetical protein